MWKALLAGTTALTLVGGTLVLAQTQNPPSPPGRDNPWRPRLSAEDRAALADARIAGLKAGLKLTPAQEKNWPAVESALRENAKQRADRFERFRKMREERRQGNAPTDGNFAERMRERADAMSNRATSLKKLAEAIDPLYKSL